MVMMLSISMQKSKTTNQQGDRDHSHFKVEIIKKVNTK